MAKRSASADPKLAQSSSTSAHDLALGGNWKAVLSVLIALHVAAIFVYPFAFASGGSPLARRAHALFRPYTGAMFLEHGYFFFAPDPGPTHLVRYSVEFDDGREPVEGVFPDLAKHRPRLLYHRHFMLAESLHNRFAAPQPPPEPVPPPLTAPNDARARYRLAREAHAEALRSWEHSRRVYLAMRESVEQHLLAKYGGSRVTLTRLERRLVDPTEVRELGMRIDDPAALSELPETSWPGDER